MAREDLGRDPAELKQKNHRQLVGFVAVYALLVSSGAICQFGRVNSDFIGYVTVAHRILDRGTWISGYWSPLYSWCMMPLIMLGVDDLIAGRTVLIMGGLSYLMAIHRIARRFFRSDRPADRVFLACTMTCATLQAAAWGTAMMDPDLLADGLLFWTLCFLLDPIVYRRPAKAFAGGLMGGLAYLAKAYMLPFLLVMVPVTLGLRWLERCRSAPTASGGRGRDWLITALLFLAGLTTIAGPWIGVLSGHYHQVTNGTAVTL